MLVGKRLITAQLSCHCTVGLPFSLSQAFLEHLKPLEHLSVCMPAWLCCLRSVPGCTAPVANDVVGDD